MSSTVSTIAATTSTTTTTTTTSSSSSSSSSSSTMTTCMSPILSSISKKPLKIVLKVGSSSLSSSDGKFVHLTRISSLVERVCDLVNAGHKLILVSSGAVSVGCQRLSLSARPSKLIMKQAVAAVGQCRLMRIYDDLFGFRNQAVAQVLLSRENLSKQHHYINALNTFNQLLDMNIVPVVNENDTVAVEELRFGDNDTLSALVASLIEADWLFLLTDVDSLYDRDPRLSPDAKPIHVVNNLHELDVDASSSSSSSSSSSASSSSGSSHSSTGSSWGTGGMLTKLQAARIATSAGVTTGIIKSDRLENMEKMMSGDVTVGTRFNPVKSPIKGKKKWIAFGTSPAGTLILDDGAAAAVLKKKSLFAAGIKSVKGSFQALSPVMLVDLRGKEVARGVANYDSDDIHKVCGLSSQQMFDKLGYMGPDEIIHRENLAITDPHHDQLPPNL